MVNGLGFREYGKLRKVLVHSPGRELDLVTPRTYGRFLFEDAIDSEKFREQHHNFVDTLRSEGVDVVTLREILGENDDNFKRVNVRPNMVYTRDSVTVTPIGYVRMRMKSPVRRGEEGVVQSAMFRLNVPRIMHLSSRATIEGGDLIFQDEDTLLIGAGNRTNWAAVNEFWRRASTLGLECLVAVSLPSGVIHLDGIVMMLDRDLALVHSRALKSPVTFYEVGHPRRKSTLRELLRRDRFTSIEVTDYERRKRATNVVTLGARKVVGYAGNGRVQRELEKRGVDFIPVEGSELVRGGGGPRCMTAPIVRD